MKHLRAFLIWTTLFCLLFTLGFAENVVRFRVMPDTTPTAAPTDAPEAETPASFTGTEAPASFMGITIESDDDGITVEALPFADKNYLLPIDFSGGSVPNPDGYVNGVFYSDSTISVQLLTGRENNCTYWIADIQIVDPSQLRTIAAGGYDSYMQMDGVTLSRSVNAVFAINGDYYNSSERYGKGYILRQGQLYRNNLDIANRWDSKMMDVLLIDEDGDFHVLYQPEKDSVPERIDGKRILNALTFGPILVDHGERVKDYSVSSRWIDMAMDKGRQRVCICQVGKLHYKAICCAGPSHGNQGMTMDQFADLVQRQNVQIAYNLDGGDSSMFYFAGERINSYGNSSMRKLQDIIYFASAESRE